jgi:hypothetical protein
MQKLILPANPVHRRRELRTYVAASLPPQPTAEAIYELAGNIDAAYTVLPQVKGKSMNELCMNLGLAEETIELKVSIMSEMVLVLNDVEKRLQDAQRSVLIFKVLSIALAAGMIYSAW